MYEFTKYHGLGNDYLVIDPQKFPVSIDSALAKKICHRNYGIGSDGILYGPFIDSKNNISLEIFNPDGSIAEKSGNGLRIFSQYLFDEGIIDNNPFYISTKAGIVKSSVYEKEKTVEVEMGRISFHKNDIPVHSDLDEVLNESMIINDEKIIFTATTIGNPHCTILCENISSSIAKKYGPLIENHEIFPNKTNVQFMKIIDENNIEIEIWERGAGYTLASGSSSCAAAACAKKLGFCNNDITVHMSGGNLNVFLSDDYHITISGPVKKICDGFIDKSFIEK